MWLRAIDESWQAEHAAVIGLLTRVSPVASQGVPTEQVARVTLQVVVVGLLGLWVRQVHGAATVQVVLPCLPVVLTTLHGLAAVHTHGAARVHTVAPWVPLLPSGSVRVRLLVAKPKP